MLHVITAPVRYSDADDLIASNTASRRHHAPWVTPFTDRQGFEAWYGRILTGPNLGFVARETSSETIVGVITLTEIVWGAFRSAYLGYYGMIDWCGRGLMTAAVAKVVKHAFDDLGLHRLEANVQPGNAKSITLIRRLAFCKEGLSPGYLKIDGVWCTHERWARLALEPA